MWKGRKRLAPTVHDSIYIIDCIIYNRRRLDGLALMAVTLHIELESKHSGSLKFIEEAQSESNLSRILAAFYYVN